MVGMVDEQKTPPVNASGASGSSGVAQNAAATYAAARAAVGTTTGDTLYVFGRTTQSDGGQGLFTWVIGANIYGDSDLRLTSTGGYWQRVRYDQVFATANPVGINVDINIQPRDEGFPFFKNRIRESGGFADTTLGTTQVAISAAGWPTVDFGVLLYHGDNTQPWLAPIVYPPTPPVGAMCACGFLTTSGTETITGILGGNVSNVVRGTAGQYTTFDWWSGSGSSGGFKVTGTSGTTSNVFCFLPAYRSHAPAAGTTGPIDDPTTADAFTREAILHYSQFAHLRLMKWSYAESNTQVSTSTTRKTPSNCQCYQGCADTPPQTLTAAPGNGATTATLAAVWPYPTGNYGLPFHSADSKQGRICACTKGNATVTFTALTQACDSTNLTGNGSGFENFPVEWMVALCNACNISIWINTPMVEDGTNSSAGTWSSNVMDYLVSNWTSTGKIYFEMGNENWNPGSPPYWILNGLAAVNGFADQAHYLAYRLHAFANLCRTKFPSKFGTQVYQIMGGRAIASAGSLSFINNILSALAQLGTPSADVQIGGVASYVLPTIGNTDSIAVIEAATAASAATRGLTLNSENQAILFAKYGMQMCAYESGGQWDAANPSNANVGLAIMDAGMTAPLTTLYQQLFDTGHVFVTHFGGGVSGLTGNKQPIDELSNLFTFPLVCPTLTALQSFMAGFAPTRNVVNGSGSVISGINYADNSAAIVNAPGAFNLNMGGVFYAPYLVAGYLPYFINCTAPGTYALTVNFTVSSGTPTTDLEVNGVVIAAKIGTSVVTGNVAFGNVTLVKGMNSVLLGKNGSQTTVSVNSLTFV